MKLSGAMTALVTPFTADDEIDKAGLSKLVQQQLDGGIDGLGDYFPRIRQAFLVGEAALGFGQVLDGKVTFTISGTVDKAIEQAFEQAKKDKAAKPVVLLSPACASWDQFKSFEDRGDLFKETVEALPGEHLDPMEAADAFRAGPGNPDGETA